MEFKKLEVKKDRWCGKDEFLVSCKFCGVNHYRTKDELWIYEYVGFYICVKCIGEKIGGK